MGAETTIPLNGDDRNEVRASSLPADDAIVFQDVCKSYIRYLGPSLFRHRVMAWLMRIKRERFRALKGVSFTLRPGESLALVGSNGAGKSTLLRLATGIAVPDSGLVKVRGTIAALIELGAGFHPDLTGSENLFLNASLLGLTRKQTIEQFDAIVEFSELKDFIGEPLRTYSSGMILRLAFSVAMRVDPDILFIDEVLSVGDQNFQRKCINEIKRFKKAGKILVCVSHSIAVVRDLCEMALWLDHGEVKMFGPASIVLDRYEGLSK